MHKFQYPLIVEVLLGTDDTNAKIQLYLLIVNAQINDICTQELANCL